MNPFSALTSKIFGGAAVALALALLYVWITMGAEIKALEKSINEPVTGWAARLEKATSDLTTCRNNTITLEDATKRQNEAVAKAKAESADRIVSLDRQLAGSRRAAADAQRRAANILAAQPGEDQCASADALILGETR